MNIYIKERAENFVEAKWAVDVTSFVFVTQIAVRNAWIAQCRLEMNITGVNNICFESFIPCVKRLQENKKI